MLPKLVEQRVASDISLTKVGVLATCVFLCGGMAQFAMGRAVERVVPHLIMSAIAAIQVVGILLAYWTSGWWLLPSLALAVAAIYGQVTVNDLVLARYTPAAWRGRIYAIRFFLIFTMAGPAAWGIGRLYDQGGFNVVLGVGCRDRGARRDQYGRDLGAGQRHGNPPRRREARGTAVRAAGGAAGGVKALAFRRAGQYQILFASVKRMGANMRCVAICSALILLAASPAQAQSRLKRDDTPPATAAQPAAPQKNAKAPKRERAIRQAAPGSTAPVVDARPRLKRDDMPAPVTAAAPATTGKKGRRTRNAAVPPGQPGEQGPKASQKDIAACGQTRDHDLAIAGCTRVIEDARQKPKGRAAAYYNRGNAHSAKGDHEQAIADYDEAIKLDPKNASAYNNRGSARSDKGESEGALDDFNAAIKLNTRYASAYFNRGNIYAAQGDERALKDYDAAVKFNRRNVNAYIARGALLLASGASAKARADMRQAARAGAQERLRGAVARHRGAARQAEGRAARRQGLARRRDEGHGRRRCC